MIADIIGQVFWFGILATPLITFLIIRKMKEIRRVEKLLAGILITFLIAAVFFAIAMAILLRDGLGPV